MSNGSLPPGQQSSGSGSGLTWLLLALLVLLAAGTAFFWYKYSDQNKILLSRETELDQLEYSVERLQNSLDTAKEQTAAAEKRIGELETRLGDMQETGRAAASLEQELEFTRKRSTDLLADLEDCKKTLESLGGKGEGHKDAVQRLQEDIADLQARNKELRTRLRQYGDTSFDEPSSSTASAATAQGADCEKLAQELQALRAQGKNGDAQKIASLTLNLDQCLARAEELEGKHKEEREMTETYETMIHDLKKEVHEKEVVIERFKDRLKINILGSILFQFSSTHITPQGRQILKKIIPSLQKVKDRQIYIMGHTDNIDIAADCKHLFPSNWEFSAARATSVVRFLIDNSEIDPALLAAVGVSFYQPQESNDTSQGRARNRRVEIVVGAPLFQ